MNTKIPTDKLKKTKYESTTQLKMKRKQTKQEFEEACIFKPRENTKKKRQLQNSTKSSVWGEGKRRTNKNRNKSQTTKIDNEWDYNIVTKGHLIADPEETKPSIADRYEALYQAQPGTPEYEGWSELITKK